MTQEEIAILVSARDQASATLSSVSSQLGQMGIGAEQAASSTNQLTNAASGLLSPIGALNPMLNEATSSFKEMSNVLSETGFGLSGIAQVSTIAATAFVALGMEAANYDNELMKTGAVTNMNAQQLQYWDAALTEAGGGLGDLQRGVLLLTRDMESAANGNANAARAFRSLGVDIKDSSGHLRDSGEVFNEVAAKMGGLTDATQRQQLAVELFGRYGGVLLTFFEHYNEIVPNAAASSEDAGNKFQNASEQALEFNKNMGDLNTTLHELGNDVLPTVTGAIGIIDDILKQFTEHMDAVTSAAVVLGQVLGGLVGAVAGFAIGGPFGAVIGAGVGIGLGGYAASSSLGVGSTSGGSVYADGTPVGIEGRQFGGSVNAGQLYRVNESGTEYFRPNIGGSVIPLGNNGGSSDSPVEITINLDGIKSYIIKTTYQEMASGNFRPFVRI